jgi:tetratricopeptide (TPR) repeat protein
VRPAVKRGVSAAALAIGLLLGVVGCDKPIESAEQLVTEAAAMRDAGNFSAAAGKLNLVLMRQPKNLPARLLAAQIYLDLERGDAALGLLMRAREDGIDQRQLIKLWAQAEFLAQRYREVVDDTDNLPDGLSGPTRASLLAYRGGALAALGRTAAAQRALADGIAADPHSVDVRIVAGHLAINRGDLAAARKLLAAAMQELPTDRRVERFAGDVTYAAGEYPAAEGIYRKILESEPWNELVRGQLAAIQVAEDKLPEAMATLDTVLLDPKSRNVPKHPLLYYVRALVAYRQQDYVTAQSNAAPSSQRFRGSSAPG